MTATQDNMIAELQRANAELRQELAARTAELAQRNSEYGERIEQQSATVDVLKVMSASPGDPQPVFDLITRRAAELCNSRGASIFEYDGELVHFRSRYHQPAVATASAFRFGTKEIAQASKFFAAFPMKPERGSLACRAILDRQVIHTRDTQAEPDLLPSVRDLGIRSILAIPLLRDDNAVGAFAMNSEEPGGFTESQVALLQTFAEQAVIAISSAETYRALQERTASLAARNSEYGERIEQQAATIDVLKVMSGSPGNAQPVFELIVERARTFCGADQCTVALLDGDMLHLKAKAGMSEASARNYAAQFPRPVNTASMFGRAILAREAVQTPDVLADPEHFSRTRVGGPDPEFRAIVAVPMLRAGAPIGAIALVRRMPGVYSAIQLELLQTFAEQAVIAVTSAETYRALQTRTSDLQESLEYQTATSDVLKVIGGSTFDLQPVFDTIVTTAARLCEAGYANITTRESDGFRVVAGYSNLPDKPFTGIGRSFPVDRNSITGRTVLAQQFVHLMDVTLDPEYVLLESARRTGMRSILGVPLIRDGVVVGTLNLGRVQVRPFTGRQIDLIRTFADQAVIAMENARLITETREALEQQTATAEVLQVINASPGDLAPVFDAMLEKAMRLCEAAFGELVGFDGKSFPSLALKNVPAAYAASRGAGPVKSTPGSFGARFIAGEYVIHIPDLKEEDAYRSGNAGRRAMVDLGGARTAIAVALHVDGQIRGGLIIYRQEVRPFSDKQIALLENFAAQAVIAMENARLITEQREALERQTATADVLRVINASPGDLTPVFDAILDKAHTLCGAVIGSLVLFDGTHFRAVATHGFPEQVASLLRHPVPPNSNTQELIDGVRFRQIEDIRAIWINPDNLIMPAFVEYTDVRTGLFVPLRKDGALLGFISAFRPEVRAFSDKEIALLENFAAQAVIAMENARLLTEQREALEQQTATAEVLQVINTSPGDLGPVFDTMLEKALTLCGAEHGSLGTYDGDYFRAVASRGYPAAVLEILQGGFHGLENPVTRPLFDGARFVHIPDLGEIDHPIPKAVAALGGFRTVLFVPMRKDGKLLGHISASRQEVRSFAAKEITLLENFAAQAVIAMENARLLDEIRQRQAELRVTFENMGDGVAMFDETSSLVAWNQKFQDILDLPDGVLAERLAFPDYIRYLTERGEYGEGAHPEEQIRRLTGQVGEVRAYERTRPDGRVIEIRRNPVPSGGFVLIFSDISERKRNEAEIRAARDAAEEASRTIEVAYRDLKAVQANLIQAEKMASLGQLTAGIAHEIKNPLNFVNNFAELSVDLLGELKDAIAPAEPALTEKQRAEVEEVSAMLASNLEKITEHGKRADGIVKAMLEHSRGSSGERRMVDLNALIDEALNLAYHGARAQDQSFNITLERGFDAGIAPIEINPQDITRVFLNLFGNGFYAVTKRARDGGDARFVPTLKVTTIDAGEAVEIRVRDNGTGIPADIRDKLFQPFFTTKPTGEGTGLGLSITYDIVTQQHGGSITVESEVGEYSEFTIQLPRNP